MADAINAIKYSAVAFNSGKPLELKYDDKGYCKVILGGFDIYNRHGDLYPMVPKVAALFAPGGTVRRRLDEGTMRGEYKHPELVGLTKAQILRRLEMIDELLISHHIRDIELIEKNDDKGKKMVLAVGSIKPTGPYADPLEKELSNSEENVAFSVRCLFDIGPGIPRNVRPVSHIFTYDHVYEGGIFLANKFSSVGLEDITREPIYLTEDDFDDAIELSSVNGIGLESEKTYLTMIKTDLGWKKIQVMRTSSIDW